MKQELFFGGFMLEHAIEQHIRKVVLEDDELGVLMDPGELFWCYTCDRTFRGKNAPKHGRDHPGIYATPDNCIIYPKEWVLAEYKFTRKSTKNAGEDHIDGCWRWELQIKGYCKMLAITKAELWVHWTHGNWKPPFKPAGNVYELKFTKRELKQQWEHFVSVAESEGMFKKGWELDDGR